MIRSGIERLGFEVTDLRILLNSHAHFDHAGGLARLQEWSGAEIFASDLDAPLLERGGLDDDLEDETYPGIGDDFRASFERLESIDCDLFVASHAEFFRLEEKRALQAEGQPRAWVDPDGYHAYVNRARERFEKALEAERLELERSTAPEVSQ